MGKSVGGGFSGFWVLALVTLGTLFLLLQVNFNVCAYFFSQNLRQVHTRPIWKVQALHIQTSLLVNQIFLSFHWWYEKLQLEQFSVSEGQCILYLVGQQIFLNKWILSYVLIFFSQHLRQVYQVYTRPICKYQVLYMQTSLLVNQTFYYHSIEW